MNRFIKLYIILLFSLNLKAQVPSATIVAPGPTLCSGIPLTFTTITSNVPTTFNWSVSPSASVIAAPDKASPSITLTFPKGGVYTLSLQVSNSAGSAVISKTITVTQSADATYNASLTTIGYPNQMILTNYSTNGINNVWLYSDVASTDVSYSAIKNYTAAGSYTITLIEYGASGCNDTSAYAFRISDSSGITLPNIFTPNNDSINDIFRPIARGIQDMNVWIYSRYGILVYSWDKPRGFWDGYNTSGEPCGDGVYFCILEATGFDGKSYKLKGTINLIR